MTVSAILDTKKGNNITLQTSASLADVCSTLAKNRIGTVLILSGSNLVGIVSERDVVRLLAASGPDALKENVQSCMTKKLVTCTRSDTVSLVMERMTAGRFRHVPIVENGDLLGIISIGDVVKYRIAEVEREAQEIRDYISTA